MLALDLAIPGRLFGVADDPPDPDPYGGAELVMDFAAGVYRLDGTVTGSPPTGWSFARASAGYAPDVGGTLVPFSSGAPRITDAGLLVENAATNLFLNSTAPATQTITLAATGAYTLSVWGTGSVAVAANTATGSGFGTATAGTRVHFTLSGTGTVDCTVTGSPGHVQLEAGAVGTSPVDTAGSTAARAADVAGMAFAAFPAAGTMVAEWEDLMVYPSSIRSVLDLFVSPQFISIRQLDATTGGVAGTHYAAVVRNTAGFQAVLDLGPQTAGRHRAAFSWTAGAVAASLDGATAVTGAPSALPNTGAPGLYFGNRSSATSGMNAVMAQALVFSAALTTAELEDLSGL